MIRDPERVERLKMARTLGQSEKRILGWEPKVTTRGYDADGRQVALADAWETVAQSEVEWDDQQRESMAGLNIFERGIHSCGFHLALTQDPASHFGVEQEICLLCAETERFDRMQAEADKQVLERMGGDKASPALARPSDGRLTFIKPKASPAVQALMESIEPRPQA